MRALQTLLQKGRVNWVLDADLSKFSDTIDHKELMAVIEHRVKDRNILRLIGKWFSAGRVETDGRRVRAKVGTPQGGVISPLLANIFLHHVLDTFVYEWRQREARGEVYIVRYADDFVICFEREDDAHAILKALAERFARYKLTLNSDKTQLVRFGRRGGASGGKSGTFDFLGFTHIAGKDRRGHYLVQRRTSGKSFRKSIKAVYAWCKVNRHQPLSLQYKELSVKLRVHYEDYGIRGNYDALSRFRQRVWRL